MHTLPSHAHNEHIDGVMCFMTFLCHSQWAPIWLTASKRISAWYGFGSLELRAERMHTLVAADCEQSASTKT
eukprot:1326539-Amphidinium_carterae.1